MSSLEPSDTWKTTIPTATYRLQFNQRFTFAQAEEIVPYLDALGISHCYASPYLKARPNSAHGYDIVDHHALNPEIGDRQEYSGFVAALHRHAMGQILDVVPNHMAVGGDDNRWWLDVLEHGPSSDYAGYFDIDWQPAAEGLRGKVLLPLLGDHYGAVLAQGQIQVRFDAARGEFSAHYFHHRCPLDPQSYPSILSACGAPELRDVLDPIIELCRYMPSRYALTAEQRAQRRHDSEFAKQALANWCHNDVKAQPAIDTALAAINGVPGRSKTFDRLHELLEAQGYRLAHWRVAADDINYRRFFNINDLAGLCVESAEVFAATHDFVFELFAAGDVNGLRIDHPDGLYDPAEYFARLQRRAAQALGRALPDDAGGPLPCYVVVEKILAGYEFLPNDWPVHGTTGYDFANLLNGLFVRPESLRKLRTIHSRYNGKLDFDDLLYARKKLIIRVQLSSELTVLTNLLNTISEQDRNTRDFTRSGLRDALTEVVACFPVYRTYISAGGVSSEDRRYVEWAVAQAKKRSPAADVTIFDFVAKVLLLQNGAAPESTLHFVKKFQQYTAPVTAKSLEDTVFYNYSLLLSLNEVGGDPRRFGTTIKAFHHLNQERWRHWPHSLLATSTHDNKRSEDVRARINVISEMPREWNTRVTRWFRLNRAKRSKADEDFAPAHDDEYFLYQTLLGVWPLEDLDETGLSFLRERLQAYMLKAIREAKTRTSWINPNAAYEAGVKEFIDKLLGSPDRNPFLDDFLPFQKRVARLGLFNSLSQALLKCTSPGVPDIYQGQELWDFSLVDPDNRRPVDYTRRRELLQTLMADMSETEGITQRARALVDGLEDGRAKLYVTWKTLDLRRRCTAYFQHGEYLPLAARGTNEDFICAHAWRYENDLIIAAAPRWFATLMSKGSTSPLGAAVWHDTLIILPPEVPPAGFRNLFTGERIATTAAPEEEPKQASALRAADVFANFPVALLRQELVKADTQAL
ncbi:MAG: malto-oligosyltrehalose synthase [Gammaproteobacteria bacterium]